MKTINWSNHILFDELDQQKLFFTDSEGKNIVTANKSFENAEFAILWRYRENDLDNLPNTNKLHYLELNWAKISNLKGISKFNQLKRLELHYCPKLANDEGIVQLGDNLEFLHINQCKKFHFTEELLKLRNLKVLCLNSCAPIESLDFLRHFPNLTDFRFVDTNILDGDLTPILEHPTLKTIGSFDKRHYNMKIKDLTKRLEQK